MELILQIYGPFSDICFKIDIFQLNQGIFNPD